MNRADLGRYYCEKHAQSALIRRMERRGAYGMQGSLLICQKTYCPVCWRMQMDEIKERGLRHAMASSRAR
jgi:hypothetical protein